MRSPSHSSPRRRLAWRVATPVVVLLSGALFAVSAEQSDGFDLRGGRLTDLASVVRAERDEAGELTARAAALNAEVEALSTELGDRSVGRAQDKIATLVDPAGLTEKTGEAVRSPSTTPPRRRGSPTRATPTTWWCTSRTSRRWPTPCGTPARRR
jgi:uncharacterized protein YlxW (UPF0749 family)